RRGLLRRGARGALAGVLRREGPGRLLVGDGTDHVAGLRDLGKTQDLYRPGRFGPTDVLALVVDHRANLPEGRARDDEVAALQGAGLHEDGRDGAAALVEVRLDDPADRRPVGVRLQIVHVSDEKHDLDQVGDALL